MSLLDHIAPPVTDTPGRRRSYHRVILAAGLLAYYALILVGGRG